MAIDVAWGVRGVMRMLALACGVCVTCASLAGQPVPPPQRLVEVNFDSGWQQAALPDAADAAAALPRLVFSDVLVVDDAACLQLHFQDLVLSGSRSVGNASFLRMISLKDDTYQRLDSISAAQWGGRSALFNGGSLRIELWAYPNTGFNRVRITAVTAGESPAQVEGGIAAICDEKDERTLSNEPRCGRTDNGCTAFLFNDRHYCLLTAGHCGVGASSVEFNVPLSSDDGSINFAHPDDQYPIDPESKQILNGACHDDWTYFGVFPNSNTGLTPLQKQQASFTLADAAPEVGDQLLHITGYGTVSAPVPLHWNKVQKEAIGPYAAAIGTMILHQVDTTGGNSGSAVVDLTSGLVIGIHTCGGCGSPGGANVGTAIDHPLLQKVLAAPKGVCTWPPPNSPCDGDIDGNGKVNVFDLLRLLGAWGECVCEQDINGDGVVDVHDLLDLLGGWGPCG